MMNELKSNEEKKLNLRVFRRNAQMLILLWDKIQEGVKLNDIEILFTEADKEGDGRMAKVDQFTLNQPPDMMDFKSKHEVVICVIDQEKNGIEPDVDYVFDVKYGNIGQSTKVFGVGVLPDREREDKKKNQHIYAWNKDKARWQKLEGVEDENGHFRLLIQTGPMKLVKTKE